MTSKPMALSLILIAGMVILWSTGALAFNLHEGEWELTTTIQGGQPMTSTECFTKKNLAEPEKNEPGCKTDKNISGNTISLHTVCNRQGVKDETRGEETFSGDTMKGTLRINGTGPNGKPLTYTGTITGKRIGACKEPGK